jgi:hypothetical protein
MNVEVHDCVFVHLGNGRFWDGACFITRSECVFFFGDGVYMDSFAKRFACRFVKYFVNRFDWNAIYPSLRKHSRYSRIEK